MTQQIFGNDNLADFIFNIVFAIIIIAFGKK